MIFYPEVWTSLALLYFIGELLSRKFYVSIAFSIFGLLTIASFVGMVSVSLVKLDLSLVTLCVAIAVVVLVVITKQSSLADWLWISIRSIGFAASAGVISFITQLYGLAGVAFSDGFTILTATSWIQGLTGDESPLDGAKGIKRGFGLPALQSLGNSGEYLVGFVPLIFVTALFCSLLIIYKVLKNRQLSAVLILALLVVLVSTESVLRHLFLMNSHAIIWLAFAVMILAIIDNQSWIFDRGRVISLLPVFSAIALVRLDAVWIFSPILIPIVLANYKANKANGLLILSSVLIPLSAWLFITVTNFPFGGYLGIAIIVIVALIGFFAVSAAAKESWLAFPSVTRIYYWASVALFGMFLFISDVGRSLDAFWKNFVLGEGLWGSSLIVLAIFGILSIYILIKSKGDTTSSMVLAIGLLSLLMYLVARAADVLESQGFESVALARPGWGDSLNRMLVAYIPFVFLFIASVTNRWVEMKTNAKKKK